MREELREQLLALGSSPDDDQLEQCLEVCRRRGLDPETFAELWVAYGLSRGGLEPEPKHLRAFENTLDASDPARSRSEPEATSEAPAAHDFFEDDPATIRPDAFSAANSQATKYSSRTNSKSTVNRFGEGLEKCVWNNMSSVGCDVSVVPNKSNNILTPKAMYGFELLQNKASMLDNNIKYLSQFILHKQNVKETAPVKTKSQIPVSIFGRIDCDSNGRLNSKSVILQGTWEDSQGHNVPINLEQMNQYSLFPGQIVLVTGMNVQGDRFTAHEIHCDASHSKPRQIVLNNNIEGSLHMVAACGPFTTSDSLTYDPLFDFVNYVKENKPHIAIFIGPFLDAKHQSLVEDPPNETYKMIFEKLLEKIMTDIESSSPHTQVVIVASSKDAFHSNVYPTPPYRPRKMYPNLTMGSDPCMLNLSGVIVGVTGTDILMHLSKEEISCPVQGPDKLGRLASHLLYQQRFYPLWPPNINLPVDVALWSDYAGMSCSPHILIVPSDFRYFTKEINGSFVVNPERLTKGIGGGTFMRLQISTSETVKEGILCEILRV